MTGRRNRTVLERLWFFIDRSGGPEACWPWTGSTNPHGYGQLMLAGHHVVRAHRQLYIELNGPLPLGIEVCHSCDTPGCCNPAHLFPGTHRQNMKDMGRKGRTNPLIRDGQRGEDHPQARLNWPAVRAIRYLAEAGVDVRVLAEAFEVTAVHVRHIVQGTTWREEVAS